MSIINIWLLLFILFFFIELMTISLVSIWFCIGSAMAILLAHIGAPLYAQITAFVIVSSLSLYLLRPLGKKLIKTQKTNYDRIIGKKAIVTKTIKGDAFEGEVSIKGQYWLAVSENGNTIPKGTHVFIKKIEGAHVIVVPQKLENI